MFWHISFEDDHSCDSDVIVEAADEDSAVRQCTSVWRDAQGRFMVVFKDWQGHELSAIVDAEDEEAARREFVSVWRCDAKGRHLDDEGNYDDLDDEEEAKAEEEAAKKETKRSNE